MECKVHSVKCRVSSVEECKVEGAMRNEASQRLKSLKMTTFAELAIGTAIATYLRTVAHSCARLPTVAVAEAASSDHVSTRRPTM